MDEEAFHREICINETCIRGSQNDTGACTETNPLTLVVVDMV